MALLFILLVVRPLLKILTARFAPSLVVAGVPGAPGAAGRPEARRAMTGEELPMGEGDMGLLEEPPRRATTRDQVLALASRTTAVLRAWIREAS